MYDKSVLKKLELPALPKKRTDAVYRAQGISYILRSRLDMGGNLLIAAFYDRESAANGFSLPAAVLYITREAYTTLVTEDGRQKWKKCRLRKALGLENDPGDVIGLRKQDEKTVKNFLSLRYSGYEEISLYIEQYQGGILAKSLERKKKWAAEEVDALMATVPRLPSCFERWIGNGPLKHSRYIFYRRQSRKIADGYCSHCAQDMRLEAQKARHNQNGVCPLCGSRITYKAIGRSVKLQDTANACILQQTTVGEFVMRYFHVTRYFTHYREHPRDILEERGRIFFDRSCNAIRGYKNGWSAVTGRWGFYAAGDRITGEVIDWEVRCGLYQYTTNLWFRPARLYLYNLRPMLGQLSLSYSLRQKLCGQPRDITTYLLQSVRYPFTSTFDKLGLHKLAEDILTRGRLLEKSKPSGSLHNRLGISKRYLRLAREQDADIDTINLIAAFQKEPEPEDFAWVRQAHMDSGMISVLTRYASLYKIRQYITRQVQRCKVSVWGKNYMQKNQIAGYWKDYLLMCGNLGYDPSVDRVLYPRHVKDEHDKLLQLTQVKFDPAMDAKIRKLYPSLNSRYRYQNGGFLLRPPENFDEFIQEGVGLLHCVCSAGYYRGHVEGDKLIFFVRKAAAPDVPFYTMEYHVQENRIAQLRGYRDKNAPKNVTAFKDQWLEAVCRGTRRQSAA